MVYAYTSSVSEQYDSTEQQIGLIKRYCENKGISVDKFYSDKTKPRRRLADEKERALKLGLRPDRYLLTFPELENMFIDIVGNASRDEKHMVLVDTRVRVYGQSEAQRIAFEQLIREYNVQIVEVGGDTVSKEQGVCIYHYTDKCLKRPLILIKQLDCMYKYASENELNITGVLIDLSIYRRSKYEELKEMLKKKKFKGVLVCNAYLLSRKIAQFILVTKLAGIVYSINEGEFSVGNVEDYIDTPVNAVALYGSNSLLFGERMKYYCGNYTSWSLVDAMDSKEFWDKCCARYDVEMIMVESYYDIENDVYRFIKNISQAEKTYMICNVKEGSVLKYDRKGSILCQSINNK